MESQLLFSQRESQETILRFLHSLSVNSLCLSPIHLSSDKNLETYDCRLLHSIERVSVFCWQITIWKPGCCSPVKNFFSGTCNLASFCNLALLKPFSELSCFLISLQLHCTLSSMRSAQSGLTVHRSSASPQSNCSRGWMIRLESAGDEGRVEREREGGPNCN